MTGDEGEGDRLAKRVTDQWQDAVRAMNSSRYEAEVRITSNLKERIDVLDRTAGIAYELKVSPNNVHFEFYRDIFKVIIARDGGLQLKRFVFLTPSAAAKKLHANMGGAVIKIAKRFGLIIAVVAL